MKILIKKDRGELFFDSQPTGTSKCSLAISSIFRMRPQSTGSQAGPSPATSSGAGAKGSLNKSGIRVTYTRGLRRITLQRVLVSKFVYNWERVSFVELIVLYDNLLWCQDKAMQDPNFQEKFGNFLEKLSLVLKERRISERNFHRSLERLSKRIKEAAEGHLIPQRNLPATEKYVSGKFHVLPSKESGVPTRELPMKPYIGIGYRDKGTRRDTARDGSPRWQDVALFFARPGGRDEN